MMICGSAKMKFQLTLSKYGFESVGFRSSDHEAANRPSFEVEVRFSQRIMTSFHALK